MEVLFTCALLAYTYLVQFWLCNVKNTHLDNPVLRRPAPFPLEHGVQVGAEGHVDRLLAGEAGMGQHRPWLGGRWVSRVLASQVVV